jgi:hypothetical protein
MPFSILYSVSTQDSKFIRWAARSGFYPCLYYHPTINLAFPFHSITYVFLMQIIWNVCRRSGIIKGRSSCILDLNTFYVLGLLKNTKMHMFPPNNRPVYNESYQLMWEQWLKWQFLFKLSSRDWLFFRLVVWSFLNVGGVDGCTLFWSNRVLFLQDKWINIVLIFHFVIKNFISYYYIFKKK